MLLTDLYKLPIGLSPAIIAVFACLLLAACSQTTKTAQNASSAPTTAAPLSPTASPTPEIEQLKVPERVASGPVTESGGAWNKAV